MKIAINCGHTLEGAGSGAIFESFKESYINRMIGKELMKQLKYQGHMIIDATIDKAETRNAYLNQTCRIANGSYAELFISIHCNASVNHNANGVECYTWKGNQLDQAVRICKEMSDLGFANRGVKDGSALYVIRNTDMKAILIELFFLDNETDLNLFLYNGVKGICEAIIKALK